MRHTTRRKEARRTDINGENVAFLELLADAVEFFMTTISCIVGNTLSLVVFSLVEVAECFAVQNLVALGLGNGASCASHGAKGFLGILCCLSQLALGECLGLVYSLQALL